jgi:hypothetical protein
MKRLQHHGARRRGRQVFVGADETEPLNGGKKRKPPMGTTIMASVIWLVFLPFLGYCLWFFITGAYINGVDGKPRNLNITNHTTVNTLDVTGSMTCSGDPIDHACLPENVTLSTINVTGSATINDLNMVGNAMCENALSSSCIPSSLNVDDITVNNLLDAQNVDLHGAVTCDSAISENCIPKNLTLDQLIVSNLTAIDFVHLNMMDLNEMYINVKVLNVEDSMTCNNTNVVDQSCFDLSGKTCSSAIDGSCVDISGETCSSAVDASCIPAITGAMIQDGTITDADINGAANIQGSKLLGNSVTSTQIQDGTIVDADINAAANIHGSKLAVGTVDTNRLVCTGTRLSPACRPPSYYTRPVSIPYQVIQTSAAFGIINNVQAVIQNTRNALYYASATFRMETIGSYGNNYFGYKDITTTMEVTTNLGVPTGSTQTWYHRIGESHNGFFEYSIDSIMNVPAGDYRIRVRHSYNGGTAGDQLDIGVWGAIWTVHEIDVY